MIPSVVRNHETCVCARLYTRDPTRYDHHVDTIAADLIAVTALITFAAILWPPAVLLVIAATALWYSYARRD